MSRNPERYPARILICEENSELLLKLASQAVLLVHSGQLLLEVRSGRVHEIGGTDSTAATATAKSRASDLRVEKVKRAVLANLTRPWTVAELAKLAGASRSAFAKTFLSTTGETPRAWLTRARLARARELLESSEGKLAEIAAEVGYTSEFALSRAFKRRYGLAPGIFRKALSSVPTAIRCAA